MAFPLAVPALLGFVKQYWLLFAAVGLFCGGYLTGCSDEKERFDSFKATVEANGRAHEAWAKRVGERQVELRKASEERYRTRVAQLTRRNDDLVKQLRISTASSIVPDNAAAPSPIGQPNAVCFDRARLAGGIQSALDGFLTGAAELLQRGDLRITALIECVTSWKEQSALGAR